ncbi:MAG TPA: DUF2844 domain-containing protein [Anaeromyxobacteraceae bacterium]|nr:DUF2844 domain-containing protein [Anaeromyxobacteraceae bacterium]
MLLALAAPAGVRASLGGTVDSIEADRSALSAVVRRPEPGSRFTVHEMQIGSTVVREYVSPQGVVFGIAWKGIAHPDLRPLLGAYAPAYLDALQKQPPRAPGVRAHTLRTDGLVVERWGHMRSLGGRAYAPSLVPAGVGIDEIG